jgi:anti-sigma factor RsiW
VNGHLLDDRIQDALDRRLDEVSLAGAREHARSCAACGARWAAFETIQGEMRRLVAPDLPPGLSAEIAAALDREDVRVRRRPRSRLYWAAGLAGVLLVGGALARLAVGPRPIPLTGSLPARFAHDFRELRAGRSAPLARRTADPANLEAYLAGQGLGFRPRVFDLAMMRQHLQGGGVVDVDGRRAALFSYRGEDGTFVLCWMYLGTIAEVPPPSERREHGGISFEVHSVEGLTVVFWPEGNVVCVLVGDGPREAVVALAFAKAQKADARS